LTNHRFPITSTCVVVAPSLAVRLALQRSSLVIALIPQRRSVLSLTNGLLGQWQWTSLVRVHINRLGVREIWVVFLVSYNWGRGNLYVDTVVTKS
jgi:hypothetical protein